MVEATLREGARHICKKRRFYVYEDSWTICSADNYDNRDQLWRVSEGRVINVYEEPLVSSTLGVHTDLQAGRNPALDLKNEFPVGTFDPSLTERDFMPAALRRVGRR